MTDPTTSRAHHLVEAVRSAALAHQSSWEALVPSLFEVNLDAEEAEEHAYTEMARHKAALRHHICETYGLSVRELASLAKP